MNSLVYHIASGQAYFSGLALVLAAAALGVCARRFARRLAVLALLVGALAMVVSSTPIPWWGIALATVATLFWGVNLRRERPARWPAAGLAAAALVLAISELPYHLPLRIAPSGARSLTVVADSLTAGMGAADQAERWPAILARERGIEVQDLSHVGETAASAAKRVAREGISGELVLLEIGGNDVLGTTLAQQFAADLETLLSKVCSPGRQVVMLELPLPPFAHAFGAAQRRLARQYGVQLVPKRVLLSIVAPRGNTVDTIHLTPTGQRRMADAMEAMMLPAPETPRAP
ncbi:MAG: GDSL-type esterase/lipase family protein [Pirellulales bacterium]